MPAALALLLYLLQADLERTRKRMNRGREKIRERCLAEEKTRREAEMAAQRPADEEVGLCHLVTQAGLIQGEIPSRRIASMHSVQYISGLSRLLYQIFWTSSLVALSI